MTQRKSKSFPGRTIREEDDPLVVDDELRRRAGGNFDHVGTSSESSPYDGSDSTNYDHVLVVLESQYTHGDGIGVEPYGYLQTKYVAIEKVDEPCDRCGHDEVIHTRSSDRTGVAGSMKKVCNRCKQTIEEATWA